MTNELIYWLALVSNPNINTFKLKKWFLDGKSILDLVIASQQELTPYEIPEKHIMHLRSMDTAVFYEHIQLCEKIHCELISFVDTRYPRALKEIDDPPLLLYARGDTSLLNTPQLAMVGTRHPSYSGQEHAFRFASQLAEVGLCITSGMAIGIDTASHQGALKKGRTIAVLGTGLNFIYPRSNIKLAAQIAEQGLLVSEFPLTTPPHRMNFPKRNRVISGLSVGVFVVEAAEKSGSLITARCALQQGREVFALPGSIQNPVSRGCHSLIRQGAKLIETIQDILEEIQWEFTLAEKDLVRNDTAPFLQFIDYETTSFDTIMQRSRLTAAQVSSMLLSLELDNLIRVVPGGYRRVGC